MKNKTRSKNEIILHSSLDATIKRLFETFKLFIDEPQLELPKPEIFDGRKERGARPSYVIYPRNPNQKLRFRTEQFNIEICGKGIAAHYFHEFTHIYDFYELIKIFNYEEIGVYTNLYGEFHATDIEMKIATGFSNKFETKEISLANEISIESNTMYLDNYIQNITSEYKINIPNWLKEYEDDKSSKNIATLLNKLLTHSMYYYSKIYFLEKYCVDDFSSLVDVSIFSNILGSEIIKIFELLKTPAINKAILISINECETKINNSFFEEHR